MDVTDGVLVEVLESSQVAEARRKIVSVGTQHGLDQKTIDRIALVCTELATNLVKHTRGGIMIAQGLSDEGNVGIEIFALDKGPGMANVQDCLKDGFSTSKTLGTGLGAIARMSDSMEISSTQSLGTIIQARLWQNTTELVDHFVGGVNVPLNGQVLSGDKWCACKTEEGFYILLVDGLGHGFEAAEAAKLAVKRFKDSLSLPPAIMINELHLALRGSRGAVGAVAKVSIAERKLQYSGLGNIGGILVQNDEHRHLTSLNGTLGYEARKVMEFSFPWDPESLLVMSSDGLSSKISEDPILKCFGNTSPSLIAASLYLHQAKTTDDATVLAVKHAG